MKRKYRDVLSILFFWTFSIGVGFSLSKLSEYVNKQYPRAVAMVIDATCVEREDGFFIAPTRYTEQRFTVIISGETVVLTSRCGVIVKGSLVQVYFDGDQWRFEKEIYGETRKEVTKAIGSSH